MAWPSGLLAFILIRRMDGFAPNTLFSKIWIWVVGIWFVFSWINFLTKGKLTAWMHAGDEQKLPKVPDDFGKFCLKQPVSPQLKLGLSRILSGDASSRRDALPDDFQVESQVDAMAVCAALKQAMRESPEAAHSILRIFWNIGSRDAFVLFRHLGMPLVFDYTQKRSAKPLDGGFNSELFDGVKLLVGFTHEPAFPLIHSLSRTQPAADKYSWVSVFGSIPMNSDAAPALVERFTAELPEAFAGVAFLDWANGEFPKGTLKRHPFDTPQGVKRLEGYLDNRNPEEYSYATSATAALIHLSQPPFSLIARASQHPDPDVKIEAAWVKAKRGDEHGLDALATFCLDWKTRGRASEYLKELGKEDRIPAEVRSERELALGTMAKWLAHPNELNRLPDQLEVIDHREIHWPPAEQRIPVTLLRWKSEDRFGVGMTGSVTWCFFSDQDKDLPILDIYAKHCNWELQANDLPDAPKEYTDLDHGRALLQNANPAEDWSATG